MDSSIDLRLMRQRIQELEQQLEPVSRGGGGGDGTFPPVNERLAVLETEFRHVRGALDDIRGDLREIRGDGRSTRTTVVVTAIASVLAIAALILGLYQAGLASQANMLSAFQSGLTTVQTAKPEPPAPPAPTTTGRPQR